MPIRMQFIFPTADLSEANGQIDVEIETAGPSWPAKSGTHGYYCYFKEFANPTKQFLSIYTIKLPQSSNPSSSLTETCVLSGKKMSVKTPKGGLTKDKLYELVLSTAPTSIPMGHTTEMRGFDNFADTSSTQNVNFKVLFHDSGNKFYVFEKLYRY